MIVFHSAGIPYKFDLFDGVIDVFDDETNGQSLQLVSILKSVELIIYLWIYNFELMGTCADKPKLQGDYEVTKKSGLRKSTKNSSKSDDIPYDQGSQENHQHRSQAGPQSEEDLKKSIFQLFDKYDTNHDGFLDKNEAENMLDDMFKRTRDQKHQITKNHVLQFFRVADLSQDEKISKEQLYRFYKIQH